VGIQLAKQALSTGVVTTNFDAMREFYVGALGFIPAESTAYPGAGTVHRFEVGKSILRIFAAETPPLHTSPDGLRDSTGIRYLTVNVTDINEAYDACTTAGAHVAASPSEVRPGVPSFRAQDPDGNWIEFLQEA
jgi:catechol 2,3-dioxygenase-like lactoylglutathione lyase family enzyme